MPTVKKSGRIVTFYSYKGGTGRTMLLANSAWLLASAGYDVLMVDWDLEAPGLHRYVAPFLTDPQMTDSKGLIDLVVSYGAEAVKRSPIDSPRPEKWYAELADVLDYSVSVNWRFGERGSLSLLPAGRQGPAYSIKVNTFSWTNFYDRLGGYAFFEAVKASMRESFDFILIDSRTGVSDTSGICTVQFPDTLIVCFTLNNQSIEGAAAVAQSVLDQKKQDPAFNIYPVPMRVDNSESDKLSLRWQLAKERFQTYPLHLDARRREVYWEAVTVPYVPKFAYEELLANFANRIDDPSSINLLQNARRTVEAIFALTPGVENTSENVRETILSLYAGQKTEKTPTQAQKAAEDEAKKSDELQGARVEVQRAHEEANRVAKELITQKKRQRKLIWATLIIALLLSLGGYYGYDKYFRPVPVSTDLFVGDELQRAHKLNEALEVFEARKNLRQKVVASDPKDNLNKQELATTLLRIGGVLELQGKLDEALSNFQAGKAIMDGLTQKDPSNAVWQRDLSITHNRIGKVLELQGKLDEALRNFQAGKTIVDRLTAKDSSNADWQGALSVDHLAVGRVLELQGKYDDALLSYQRSNVITEKLVARDFSNLDWQSALVTGYMAIGRIFEAKGKYLDALSSYDSAKPILERILKSNPKNIDLQREFALNLIGIGRVFELQGHFDKALSSLMESTSILERAINSDPRNSHLQYTLAVALNRTGRVFDYDNKNKIDEALTKYNASKTINEQVIRAYPSNLNAQRELSVSYLNIGLVQNRKGQFTEAIVSLSAAADIRQRLASQSPTNALWKRDLMQVWRYKSFALLQESGATALIEKSRQLYDSTIPEKGSEVFWWQEGAAIYDQLGSVSKANGRLSDAKKAYETSLGLLDKLKRLSPDNAKWKKDSQDVKDRLTKIK